VPYWGTQRVLGLSAGVAGVVGIVIGSIYGVKAASKDAESLPHCLPSNKKLCDAQGVALGEDAFDAAAASTAGFVAGGVGLVGGTILFFTAPSGSSQGNAARPLFVARPVVGPGIGGLSLRGEW
jgi:serine/threonine-protein kinase